MTSRRFRLACRNSEDYGTVTTYSPGESDSRGAVAATFLVGEARRLANAENDGVFGTHPATAAMPSSAAPPTTILARKMTGRARDAGAWITRTAPFPSTLPMYVSPEDALVLAF
jgi:hypothetical protein